MWLAGDHWCDVPYVDHFQVVGGSCDGEMHVSDSGKRMFVRKGEGEEGRGSSVFGGRRWGGLYRKRREEGHRSSAGKRKSSGWTGSPERGEVRRNGRAPDEMREGRGGGKIK